MGVKPYRYGYYGSTNIIYEKSEEYRVSRLSSAPFACCAVVSKPLDI